MGGGFADSSFVSIGEVLEILVEWLCDLQQYHLLVTTMLPRKSKGGDRQDGQQARDGSDDPEAHRPAWQRNLIKEFEEVDAIEAAAIRIRRDLQNLNEETERADVDAEAAALMLDLRGKGAT